VDNLEHELLAGEEAVGHELARAEGHRRGGLRVCHGCGRPAAGCGGGSGGGAGGRREAALEEMGVCVERVICSGALGPFCFALRAANGTKRRPSFEISDQVARFFRCYGKAHIYSHISVQLHG